MAVFTIALCRLGACFHVVVRVTIGIIITRLGSYLRSQFRINNSRIKYAGGSRRLRIVTTADRVGIGDVAVALMTIGHIIVPVTCQWSGVSIDRTGFLGWGGHVGVDDRACLLPDDDVSEKI